MLQNLMDGQMSKERSLTTYNQFYEWVTKGYNSKPITRSKDRIVETNEIFTNLEIVVYGLKQTYSKEFFADQTIIYSDCCAGEGAWLVGMALLRMSEGDMDHATAISTLRGVDLMEDNVQLCRDRLLCGREDLRSIVEKNIVCADALTYHYRFDGTDPLLSDQDLHVGNLFDFG